MVNPYELKIGDQIKFRLVYKGQPLANQVVHYSFRPVTKGGSRKTGEASKEEHSTRTDHRGDISFEISDAGRWYVATIHMLPVESDEIDYESNWATLTFEIK
jgi:uncharacterized GH25 family protein